ncbi:hypothetical protein ACFY0R_39700 [Streptomyces sp. NPDC001633]|uniref:hypothetical protein n=1 Tax=Streptomyces sp. NPDC001633 TaxID=3364595 RepID=UPI0036B8389B
MTEFSGSLFERAQEAPEEVVVTRGVAETQGLQPEDLGVLVFLLLLEPGVLMSGRDIVAAMKALGWKMSDERFAKIAKRLMVVGHLLRKSVYNPDTGRPQWCYWAYRNPANNPTYVSSGADTLSQVNDENREMRVSLPESPSEDRKKRVLPGQSRKPQKAESGGNTAKSGFRSGPVSAGQSQNPQKPGSPSLPPHPPEEVTTSSPYPLTAPAGSLPSREEEEVPPFTDEQQQQARVFLGRLPYPWTVGRDDARRMAVPLLDAATEQGWELNWELSAELTKNPGGVRNHVRTLEKVRIPNLIRREMAHPADQPTPAAAEGGHRGASRAEIEAAKAARLKRGSGL